MLILTHTLVQRCSFHSGKYRPFPLMQFFPCGIECITEFAVTSTSSQVHSARWWQKQFSLSSQSSTHFYLYRLRQCFSVYWCISVFSVSCFKVTVITFGAEAAPPCLRTQSLYLTQVMREAGRANLSAPNSSPVSRYGLFTRLSLHTNELFNNSVGQRNKLSAESCGNSSGTDEDLTSGTACLSSQVLLSWDQLRAPVFTLQRDHLQVGMKTRFPSACLLQNTES